MKRVLDSLAPTRDATTCSETPCRSQVPPNRFPHKLLQLGWLLLLATLLLGLSVMPAGAASSVPRRATHQFGSTTSVNATIYITLGTLQPIFQSRINDQVPVAVSSAITSIVSKLPQKDQAWATQMATTLIQPSATLTSLTTQSNGLATSLRVSLYPGDPQPINASMLIILRVINSSTVQVSAMPLSGSPALVNGPLATFQIPIGQLNSISMTPTCGDAALGINLQFPVALGQGQASIQLPPAVLSTNDNNNATAHALNQEHPRSFVGTKSSATDTNSYVELPASSLASIGSSIGDIPISGSTMTAKNIQIGVQGSNLVTTSDIYDSFWGKIGTAVTTMVPTASGGNLAVHVLNTNFTILNIFTFPMNTYNQQIEQTLNAKLNGALKGKFYVSQAAIGPNAQLPCAAGNSLLLTGTASLG